MSENPENPPEPDDIYSVADEPTPEPDPVPEIKPAPKPASESANPSVFRESAKEAKQPIDPDQDVEVKPEKLPGVSPPWSRLAELGPPIAVLGLVVVLCVLAIVNKWLLIGVLLAAGFAYSGYYFAISLEVPVRVIPEQAIREYFNGLNHRIPNFRRMYLLLSDQGRKCEEYSELKSFTLYWQRRLNELSDSSTWMKPFSFTVEEYTDSRSASDKWLVGEFTLVINRAGIADPIGTFRLRRSLVKGPDGSWYLNSGRIPQ